MCVRLPSISHNGDNWVWIWISSILQESDRISKAGEDGDEGEEEKEAADPSALQLHWGLEGLISRPSEAVTHSERHQSEPLSRRSSPTWRPRVFSCLGWITNTSPAPAHFSSLVHFSSYLLYATASFYPRLGRNSLPKGVMPEHFGVLTELGKLFQTNACSSLQDSYFLMRVVTHARAFLKWQQTSSRKRSPGIKIKRSSARTTNSRLDIKRLVRFHVGQSKAGIKTFSHHSRFTPSLMSKMLTVLLIQACCYFDNIHV